MLGDFVSKKKVLPRDRIFQHQVTDASLNANPSFEAKDESLLCLVTEAISSLSILDDHADQFLEVAEELFSEIMGKHSSEKVFEVLKQVSDKNIVKNMDVLYQAFRNACLYFNGEINGKLYKAHFKMMPLMVFGDDPKSFIERLDTLTLTHIGGILKQYFVQSVDNGRDYFALPVSYVYTLDEISNEPIYRIQEICRNSFIACNGRSEDLAFNCIVADPSIKKRNRVDSEILNFKTPSIGVDSWNELGSKIPSGSHPIKRLPLGNWVTMRFIPVVVFFPSESPSPIIDGFSHNTLKISQILNFATKKVTSQSEKENTYVIPLGMYDFDEARSIAKINLGQQIIFKEITNMSELMESEKTWVSFDYNSIKSSLRVVVSDGIQAAGNEVLLSPGRKSQQFIDELAKDITALGMSVEVDLGDSMLFGNKLTSYLIH